MTKTPLLIATLALFVAAPAMADSKESTSLSGTDAAGTTSTVDQTIKTKDHKDGSTETSVKTEATKDPKGLMNKSSVKSTETTTTDKDGKVIKAKKSENGTFIDESTKK